jgi:predicted GIY-YIG superfamily endonuclease
MGATQTQKAGAFCVDYPQRWNSTEGPVKPLYEDEFWDVSIQWTRPMSYDGLLEHGSEHDEYANFYMILGRFASKSAKILYIGMTYQQWVSKRLSQPDHQKRYATFVNNYKHHRFQVSHGYLNMNNGNITEKRVKDIEQILIFSNDSTHAHNVKNIYSHGVTGSYRIENKGYRCSLPKRLSIGLFVTY